MNNKAIIIRISPEFDLIYSCQSLYINVLLIYNIDIPKYKGLFNFTFVFVHFYRQQVF